MKTTSLTIYAKHDSTAHLLPRAARDAALLLANVVWAGDMNVGDGNGNGPEFGNAWRDADAWLESLGLYQAYDEDAEFHAARGATPWNVEIGV